MRSFACLAAVFAALAIPASASADPLFSTTITYDGPTVVAQGQGVTLSATLSQDGFAPVVGAQVDLALGNQSCTATTDDDGEAACGLGPVTADLGPQTVTASFAGDDVYAPSQNTSASTIVFAFAGHFVLGDRTVAAASAAGGALNFWGPSWYKTNDLTYSAPASFKGYADVVDKVTSCDGGSWTTRPGNSSKPPAAPLPSYMGIVVSSRITKSGPTISGDATSIVVVKTDPGYGAAPGHRGYGGVIVGTYCEGGVL
jgi:hypothetical protein